MHEDTNEDDSGLPRRVGRKKGNFKYQKEGWIEEIDDKLRDIKIEIIDAEEKALVKTNNKFLMEHVT